LVGALDRPAFDRTQLCLLLLCYWCCVLSLCLL